MEKSIKKKYHSKKRYSRKHNSIKRIVNKTKRKSIKRNVNKTKKKSIKKNVNKTKRKSIKKKNLKGGGENPEDDELKKMEFAIMQRTADGSDFVETRKIVFVKKGWKLSDVRENIDLDENNGPWVFFDKGEGKVFDYEHEGNTPASWMRSRSEDYENEDTLAEDMAISEDYENEDTPAKDVDCGNEIINLTKENSEKEKEIKKLKGIIENENSGDNSDILSQLEELQGLFKAEVTKTTELHQEVKDQKDKIVILNHLNDDLEAKKYDLEAKENLLNEKERTIETKVNEKSNEQIEAAELRAKKSEERAKKSEERVNAVNDEIDRVIEDKESAVSAKDTKIEESEEFLIKIMNVLNPQSEFEKLTQKFNKLADKIETKIAT